jgi:uroporphyrinogen-III synthase
MSQPRRNPLSLRPLHGCRIVVTRAREQGGDLVQALERLGAEVVFTPVIRIEAFTDLEPLRLALAHIAAYRWVAFTSQNAVRIVCDRLPTWGYAAAPTFGQTSVAAIGPATAAALAERGIRVDLVPPGYVADSLVEALAQRGGLAGARVLIPRAEGARDALPEGLRRLGAEAHVILVYRTVAAPGDGTALAREILAGRIDVVTFTSSSTVHHFVTLVGADAARSGRYGAAVIGPITAATARDYGLPVVLEAVEYTTAGLVAALEQYFRERAR